MVDMIYSAPSSCNRSRSRSPSFVFLSPIVQIFSSSSPLFVPSTHCEQRIVNYDHRRTKPPPTCFPTTTSEIPTKRRTDGAETTEEKGRDGIMNRRNTYAFLRSGHASLLAPSLSKKKFFC